MVAWKADCLVVSLVEGLVDKREMQMADSMAGMKVKKTAVE